MRSVHTTDDDCHGFDLTRGIEVERFGFWEAFLLVFSHSVICMLIGAGAALVFLV